MEESGAGGEETVSEEATVAPEPESCTGCSRPIRDRYIYKVLDRAWHATCLRCQDCGAELKEKCFCRQGFLFCRGDFYRRYGVKCTLCGEGIPPTTVVRRAVENVYHMDCFKCTTCLRQLDTGDEFFLLEDGKLVCKEDNDKAIDPNSESAVKRPRTTIASQQQDVLKVAYAKTSRPSRQVREELAKETGLTARVVQVWFQNKRAKERRSQKESHEVTKSSRGSSKSKRGGGMRTSPPTEELAAFEEELTTDTSSKGQIPRKTRSQRTSAVASSLLGSTETMVPLKQADKVFSVLPELKDEPLPEIEFEIETGIPTELDFSGQQFESSESVARTPNITQHVYQSAPGTVSSPTLGVGGATQVCVGHLQTLGTSHYAESYIGSEDYLNRGILTASSTGTSLERSSFTDPRTYDIPIQSGPPLPRFGPSSVVPRAYPSVRTPVSSSGSTWFQRPPSRPH